MPLLLFDPPAPGSAPHIQFWEPVSKNGTKRSVKIYWKVFPSQRAACKYTVLGTV